MLWVGLSRKEQIQDFLEVSMVGIHPSNAPVGSLLDLESILIKRCHEDLSDAMKYVEIVKNGIVLVKRQSGIVVGGVE